MDIAEVLLNEGLAGGQGGKAAKSSALGAGADIDAADEKRKKVAKDFESVFIHELLKKMGDTIPESDMDDGASKQIKGMYWSHMAQAIADKGGFGLWKNIYDAMPETGSEAAGQQEYEAVQAGLDKSV
jgi:Rod binding domain-containing protein